MWQETTAAETGLYWAWSRAFERADVHDAQIFVNGCAERRRWKVFVDQHVVATRASIEKRWREHGASVTKVESY